MIDSQEPRRPCLSCRGRGWKYVTSRRVLVGQADTEAAGLWNVRTCRDCTPPQTPARDAA
jgi:hypothetical protein